MMTEEERNKKTQRLAKVSYDLLHRKRAGARAAFRIQAWRFTIAFSYWIKRSFDVMLSGTALFFLGPLLILLVLWIRLDSPGPAIYRQIRVGRFGRHFQFYKFRTMRTSADQERQKLLSQNQSGDGVIFKMKQDPRITRIGKYLRKFSIDEIPQLFNVLLGDMSLVGPRPPLPSEVQEYTLEERKRLNVIPGLTCIWQISGRSDIPFNQQVQLDKAYITSHGFWSDFRILLKTIPAVLTGRGAY